MVVYVLGVLDGIYLVMALGARTPIWVAWVDIIVVWVAIDIVGADIAKALFFEKADTRQICDLITSVRAMSRERFSVSVRMDRRPGKGGSAVGTPRASCAME